MAKKSHKKTKLSTKYQSFKLHGNHPIQKVLIYAVPDLLLGVALGYVLQPYITFFITTYAAGSAY